MAFQMQPVPPTKEDLERKPSKIITAEENRNINASRDWLVKQTGIAKPYWSEEAVRQLMQITPAPILWKNRIALCIPLAEIGYTFFWQMLIGAVKYIGWHMDNNLVMTNSGQFLPDAHNTMVKAMLEIPGWNYLGFLEHDHTFPSNMLEIASEYTDPIVGGLYFNRVVEDPQPVVYYWNSTRTAIGRLQPFQMAPILENRGIYEVDVVPMGCTFIRRDVFENWPKDTAWFAAPTSPANGKQMSDDVWFCRHAQEQGYKIKVDTRIEPKHWGMVGIDSRMYISWFQAMKREGKTGPVEEHVWEPEAGNIQVQKGALLNGNETVIVPDPPRPPQVPEMLRGATVPSAEPTVVLEDIT